jgi:hypothetical protein
MVEPNPWRAVCRGPLGPALLSNVLLVIAAPAHVAATVLLLGSDNSGQQLIRGCNRVVQELDEGRTGTSGSDGPGAASADEEHLPEKRAGGGRGHKPARLFPVPVVPPECEDLERHRGPLPLTWTDQPLHHEQPTLRLREVPGSNHVAGFRWHRGEAIV